MYFLLGLFVGAGIALFITTTHFNNRENEIYVEGYLVGKKDKLSHEIRTIEAEAEYCRELAREHARITESVESCILRKKAEAFDSCVRILEKSSERED